MKRRCSGRYCSLTSCTLRGGKVAQEPAGEPASARLEGPEKDLHLQPFRLHGINI